MKYLLSKLALCTNYYNLFQSMNSANINFESRRVISKVPHRHHTEILRPNYFKILIFSFRILISFIIIINLIFLFSDLELKPVGRLEVKLVQAKELTNKDIIGKSDPYAVLYVRPIRSRTKTSKTIVRSFSSIPYQKYVTTNYILMY